MPQVGLGLALGGRGGLVEADDNSQMKICNKKQYIYFIYGFEQLSVTTFCQLLKRQIYVHFS